MNIASHRWSRPALCMWCVRDVREK